MFLHVVLCSFISLINSFIRYRNLTSPYKCFYVTYPYRALQNHDLSGEGSHRYFMTTQGHGEPPRMSDQLNAGANSESTRTLKTIHTIHSLTHSNKAVMRRMIMLGT